MFRVLYLVFLFCSSLSSLSFFFSFSIPLSSTKISEIDQEEEEGFFWPIHTPVRRSIGRYLRRFTSRECFPLSLSLFLCFCSLPEFLLFSLIEVQIVRCVSKSCRARHINRRIVLATIVISCVFPSPLSLSSALFAFFIGVPRTLFLPLALFTMSLCLEWVFHCKLTSGQFYYTRPFIRALTV